MRINGLQATMQDFRDLAALIGTEKHWHPDDGKDALSPERAAYWRDIIIHAHIPQLLLAEQLRNNEESNPERYRERVSYFLTKRALLFVALDHAVIHNQHIKWPDMST